MLLLFAWNLFVFAVWGVCPFVAAGTVAWVWQWSYLGAIAAGTLAHQLYVRTKNPGLRKKRSRIGPGTKRWDIVWNALFWPLLVAMSITAGFEYRAHGPGFPAWTWIIGAAVLAAGFAVSAWAMATNPHFEGTVRIQEDHKVIDSGPYRRVRHPGYVGLALWSASAPFLLLSKWALIPAAAAVAWVVLRTALEDATLRRELPGYSEYAARVRGRLVPGIW
jgi:protein-S-isoprenylcysteine O-methyltransferase Ste14